MITKRLLFACASFAGYSAKPQNIQLTLSTSHTSTTISRHIYGQFAEHLGRCIYDGFYRDGIGPIASRPGTINTSWGMVKDYLFAVYLTTLFFFGSSVAR